MTAAAYESLSLTLPAAVALVRCHLARRPAGPLAEHCAREVLLAGLAEGLPPACWPGLLVALGAGRTRTTTASTEPPVASLRKWLVRERAKVPGVPPPYSPPSGPGERRMKLVNWRSR